MEYSHTISNSEAKYLLEEHDKNIKINPKTQQSSYNLPSNFFDDAKDNNVLVQDTRVDYGVKPENGNVFVLSDEYRFNLGQGAKWLLSEKDSSDDNKFIGIYASNKKFQLKRAVYNSLDKKEYGWFVKLYDKNLVGNELVLDINDKNKVLTLDIRFNGVSQSVDSNQVSSRESTIVPMQDNINLPHNRIVFGAPGTGKSNKLERDKSLFNDNFERVTFHPNYSYAQFVGTYKPVPIKEEIKKADGTIVETTTITYKYVPGPFMRTYVKAIKSIKEQIPLSHLLLIEEINRANVASVFGDVFQLLDRNDDGKSEYEIETSEDMRSYLASELNGNESDYERISIPNNMFIWATMNSADQGVFPMDTAFKRRWNFEYIGINENSNGIKDIKVKLGEDQHEVNWNKLRMAINEKLSKICKVNEDKLLGPYFLSKDVIKTTEENHFVLDNKKFLDAFKSKVLMYLYEDAGKQYKQKLFEGCKDYSKYSSVCEEFEKIGEAIFGDDIVYKVVVAPMAVDGE